MLFSMLPGQHAGGGEGRGPIETVADTIARKPQIAYIPRDTAGQAAVIVVAALPDLQYTVHIAAFKEDIHEFGPHERKQEYGINTAAVMFMEKRGERGRLTARHTPGVEANINAAW